MKANKIISFFLILSVLTLPLAGCLTLQKPREVVLKPDSTKQQSNNMSKRFQGTVPNGQTAVDSAIKLAQEHTELSGKMTVLQQKNQELITENHQLKDRVATLGPKLKQAKKELAEANDLLIEMRIELNNWKTDILGFRDEIRESFTVQGKLLLKIAEALGAEVIPEQEENKHSTETLTSGDPNE